MEAFFLELHPYVKSLHIIFVITWFAGLFYGVRLLIYWTEAQNKPLEEKEILSRQYEIMSRRLWYIITIPSSILTLLCGLYLLMPFITSAGYFKPWLHTKILFVCLLYAYQIYFYRLHQQMCKHIFPWTSFSLRLWNEVATLLLFAIVFLVVLKDTVDMLIGVSVMVVLTAVITISVYLYRNNRKKME